MGGGKNRVNELLPKVLAKFGPIVIFSLSYLGQFSDVG